MPRKTLICVDTYVPTLGGKLALFSHREVKTEEEGRLWAEEAIGRGDIIGSLVYSVEPSENLEAVTEPLIIAKFGRTPQD